MAIDASKVFSVHQNEHRLTPEQCRAMCNVATYVEVTQISGLSAHADYQELVDGLRPVGAPTRTFITDGEPSASAALQAHLEEALGWRSEIPGDGDAIRIGAPR